MGPVILTLQVPKWSKGIPVATTANDDVLRLFRKIVLAEARSKIELASDEVESLLARLELERLERALSGLIPEVRDVEELS